MTVLFLLVPLALALGGVFLLGFLLAARGGQLEDLETPALRALIDDSESVPSGRDRLIPERKNNGSRANS